MNRLERAALLIFILWPFAAFPAEDQTLTVVSWGGAYEESQRIAYFEPFTRATGTRVVVEQYNGGLEELRAELADGETDWDIIDLVAADARAGCAEGLLRPIDPAILAPAPDGTPAAEDFIDGALLRCAVVQLIFSTVIAYDEQAFPGEKPQNVTDIFDVERFPGKRAFKKAPEALLEWALLSYGVPRSQLYDLLSTERGLSLVFRRLDSIREHIIWWEDAASPSALLADGKAAMASGYNGRFFDARAVNNTPIAIIWDDQILDYDAWAIPAGSDQPALAESFVRFATRADRMAAQVRHIPYGPARRSAMRRIGLHPKTLTPMQEQLPTARHHLGSAIWQDSEWYARTARLRQRLFRAWVDQAAAQTAQSGGDD